MTSAKARTILEAEYGDSATIVEYAGNPNIMGMWLFRVDGNVVYVDNEGDVYAKVPNAKNQQN